MVLAPKWLSSVDNIEEDLLKDDRDELKVMIAHADAGEADLSWFPKPWLLKGEVANEYWRRVYNRWMEREARKCAGMEVQPEPEIPPEIEAMIEDDKQFWNYKDDITPDKDGELPRWKYQTSRTCELFNWLPWGKPGCFCQIQASSIELTESIKNEVQNLGDPEVKILGSDEGLNVSSSSHLGKEAPECVIYAAVDEETLDGFSFSTSMAYAPCGPRGRGYYQNSCGSRGGYYAHRGRVHNAYSYQLALYEEEFYEIEERLPHQRRRTEYSPPSAPNSMRLPSPLPIPKCCSMKSDERHY